MSNRDIYDRWLAKALQEQAEEDAKLIRRTIIGFEKQGADKNEFYRLCAIGWLDPFVWLANKFKRKK